MQTTLFYIIMPRHLCAQMNIVVWFPLKIGWASKFLLDLLNMMSGDTQVWWGIGWAIMACVTPVSLGMII